MADRKDPFAAIPPHARERVRFKTTEAQLASNRILGGATSVQEIAKRNGYENHKDFWLALLAKPLPASTYAFLLRSYHSRLDAPDLGALEMGFRANTVHLS
jgi:hypothetical protein